MDLIFAEATPAGRAGVSVMRISGEGARSTVESLAGQLTQSRRTYLRTLRDGDEILDQALVAWFEKGHSFTGEEVAEIQLHGAPVIVRRLEQLFLLRGLRLADPGEFSRRSFINGKMDLAEIEGLGDLLHAETDLQRRMAMRTMGGELSRKAADWRGMLIRAGALIEASIDFADEDVPEDIPVEVWQILGKLTTQWQAELDGGIAAERIRSGFEVAVIGPPNVGKSSLINRIAKRDIALVSEIAGTTRDIIEVRLDLRGLAVTLLDTAGLRDSVDQIETMGIDLAKRRAAAADLRVHLSDDGQPDAAMWVDGDIIVVGKSDLLGVKTDSSAISSVSGDGIYELLDSLYDHLSFRVANASSVSHLRQRVAISEALAAIQNPGVIPPEILAEAVRQSTLSLDQLVGKIGSEDYLDVIFSSFCIGK